MNVVAIITARSASSRLPNKALADICGKPMLLRIEEEVRRCQYIDKVVVATVVGDEPIIGFCGGENIPYYAGSEEDILGRIYATAKTFEADIIVRIWGDSPLIVAWGISEALQRFFNACVNYVCRPQQGQAVGILAFADLIHLNKKIKSPEERHWFHKTILESGEYSALKLGAIDAPSITVDTQKDLEEVRKIWAKSEK